MPDKNNDDDTSTIDNDDCNDDVTIPNKNIDAVVGQFKNQKNVIIILIHTTTTTTTSTTNINN